MCGRDADERQRDVAGRPVRFERDDGAGGGGERLGRRTRTGASGARAPRARRARRARAATRRRREGSRPAPSARAVSAARGLFALPFASSEPGRRRPTIDGAWLADDTSVDPASRVANCSIGAACVMSSALPSATWPDSSTRQTCGTASRRASTCAGAHARFARSDAWRHAASLRYCIAFPRQRGGETRETKSHSGNLEAKSFCHRRVARYRPRESRGGALMSEGV